MTGSALGGNMIKSRLKKIAIVAGAGAVAAAGVLALDPFSAGAADAVTTTTTVTAPAHVTTGHAVTFVATIAPSKTGSGPVVKATGDVAFTIVGSDSSSVACSGGNSPALNTKGKALCKVASGALLASASPYSVTAVYSSGDSNFSGSTGTRSQSVSAATDHLKLTYDAKPTSGSATTFTATVTGGSGSLPTGTVQFSVSSTPAPGNTALLKCASGNTQTLAANGATPPVATATCALSAKWFKVPTASKNDPHPVGTWTVTATYSGDGNFGTSNASKSGASKT
jgi:large repetitive protein